MERRSWSSNEWKAWRSRRMFFNFSSLPRSTSRGPSSAGAVRSRVSRAVRSDRFPTGTLSRWVSARCPLRRAQAPAASTSAPGPFPRAPRPLRLPTRSARPGACNAVCAPVVPSARDVFLLLPPLLRLALQAPRLRPVVNVLDLGHKLLPVGVLCVHTARRACTDSVRSRSQPTARPAPCARALRLRPYPCPARHLIVWVRPAVALVKPAVLPGVAPRQWAHRCAPCHRAWSAQPASAPPARARHTHARTHAEMRARARTHTHTLTLTHTYTYTPTAPVGM